MSSPHTYDKWNFIAELHSLFTDSPSINIFYGDWTHTHLHLKVHTLNHWPGAFKPQVKG